jgi:hypothetical protein
MYLNNPWIVYICLNKSVEWFKVQKNEFKALHFVTVLCFVRTGTSLLFRNLFCYNYVPYPSLIIELV